MDFLVSSPAMAELGHSHSHRVTMSTSNSLRVRGKRKP